MARFRVMTRNVENLFDVGDDDGPKTQAQFAAKIESLRAVIDAQQPHVLTLAQNDAAQMGQGETKEQQ